MASTLVVRRLADILLIQALRAMLNIARSAAGWIGALSDARRGGAIALLHDIGHG
jgi:hypothetical protein